MCCVSSSYVDIRGLINSSEQQKFVSDDSSWNMLEVIARVSPERFDFLLFVMAGKMGGNVSFLCWVICNNNVSCGFPYLNLPGNHQHTNTKRPRDNKARVCLQLLVSTAGLMWRSTHCGLLLHPETPSCHQLDDVVRPFRLNTEDKGVQCRKKAWWL